ncbi:MAG: hypothetical protein H7X93_02360 [Sphingomonadaceae bacterium]|nr:hypothetical protein [Sphingomonadaceae bacterium]
MRKWIWIGGGMIIAIVIAALLLIRPEAKIRDALIEAGVSEPVAACIGERVADRLPMVQLWRLSSLSRLRRQPIEALTLAEFVRATRGLRDPEVQRIAAAATVVCTLRYG